MGSKTPYMGRRLGTPAQPSTAHSRENPYAVIEGRYNRGIGQVVKRMLYHDSRFICGHIFLRETCLWPLKDLNGEGETGFGQVAGWVMHDRRLPYDWRVGIIRTANTPWFRSKGCFLKPDRRHKVILTIFYWIYYIITLVGTANLRNRSKYTRWRRSKPDTIYWSWFRFIPWQSPWNSYE